MAKLTKSSKTVQGVWLRQEFITKGNHKMLKDFYKYLEGERRGTAEYKIKLSIT